MDQPRVGLEVFTVGVMTNRSTSLFQFDHGSIGVKCRMVRFGEYRHGNTCEGIVVEHVGRNLS